MKKLYFMIVLILLLLSCPLQVIKYVEGEKGDKGKDGKEKQHQIILVYDGITINNWQDIDLSFLNGLNLIEIKVFNLENNLNKCCCDNIKFSYQIENGDVRYFYVQYWNSDNFYVNKNTKLKWISYPYNKKIKIYIIY